MKGTVFMGDSVSAAGFRLGGCEVVTPEKGEEEEAFRAARGRASLLLITAEMADRLPEELLEKALATVFPLVLTVPDARGRQTPPDLEKLARARLGLEE